MKIVNIIRNDGSEVELLNADYEYTGDYLIVYAEEDNSRTHFVFPLNEVWKLQWSDNK